MSEPVVNEPRSKWVELKDALATLGFRHTCTVMGVRFADAWFDWRYGLDTVNRVGLNTLDIGSANKGRGYMYRPAGLPVIRALLRAVPLPHTGGFVDYGCGKGRVLLLAAEAGFSRVIGIEFAPPLCGIARENAVRYRRAKPGLAPIEVLEADAAQYEPPADTSVFFLHCPFDEGLTREAVGRIVASLHKTPREGWLLYHLPHHRQAVESYREFTVERELLDGGYESVVYRHRPAR